MSEVFNSYLQQRADKRRRLWRGLALRVPIYLIVLPALFVFGLRRYEYASTFHPVRYEPGPRWSLPPGGEDAWFSAPSGERLHGWFVRSQQSDEPKATILYAHGNGGNLSRVGWLARQLSVRGFDVLLFDYRGYGRSEGEVADEQQLYEDADAAYEYLVRERHIPPQQLVLYGQSLGTTAAIDLASRRDCRALVVESGLSSVSDMAATALPWLPRPLHALSRNRFDSAAKIQRARCPALVTHGDPDSVIPAEQGRKIYAAARGPKKLVIFPGGEHNVSGVIGDPYFELLDRFIRASAEAPGDIRGEEVWK
ncbi:MAG: alpha/beta hydrolase [Pyrinomonadaceae bacterium]